jgi:hypothetical protein
LRVLVGVAPNVSAHSSTSGVAPAPARPPAVGDLVHDGTVSAIVVEALPAGPDVLAGVLFVRGRHGRAVYRVTGCPLGGELVDVTTGSTRPWSSSSTSMWAQIGRAACTAVAAPARPEGAA